MTDEVAALREQLALACRMLAHEGLFDRSGHISTRHPDEAAFLIHPHALSRYEVTTDQLLLVDFDGWTLEGGVRLQKTWDSYLSRARPAGLAE